MLDPSSWKVLELMQPPQPQLMLEPQLELKLELFILRSNPSRKLLQSKQQLHQQELVQQQLEQLRLLVLLQLEQQQPFS